MLKLCVLTCFANMLQWAESFVGTQRCLPVVVAQLVASQCASAVHVILSVSVVHVDSVPASQCTSAVHVFLCDCCASQFPVPSCVPVCLCLLCPPSAHSTWIVITTQVSRSGLSSILQVHAYMLVFVLVQVHIYIHADTGTEMLYLSVPTP